MFAFSPRTETIVRIATIAAILLNALIPIPAVAMSSLPDEKNDSSWASHPVARSTTRQSTFPISSGIIQQQDVTPEATESLTPEPTSTIDIPPVTETPTPVPTIEATPTPSDTPTPTQFTTTPSAETPVLSVHFYPFPAQAKPGDQATFILDIVNNGNIPVTGLHFSNILPGAFTYLQGESDEFSFDTNTRKLTWIATKSDPAQDVAVVLLPGESLAIKYSVMISLDIQETKIVDSASLSADGLNEPLALESTLVVAGVKSSVTLVDEKGGEATGLDGRVRVNLPEKSLDTPAAISIKDVSAEFPDESKGQLWLVFELNLHQPQVDSTQPALAEGTTEVSAENTATPTADTPPGLQEKDHVLPLKKVKTKFEKPVDLTVSLDNLVDLSTLPADKEPYLVTLDEESNTWVRVPLSSINREANTVSAELTHFSIWGVGVGSSFPTYGASVLLFDSAYPSLFKGSSNYSLPIWTPPGRNGMAPALALSYSSSTVDGVLGDVQAPWAGMGWSVDTVEIARKITNGGCDPCGSGAYGYENKFLLLFNGTGYELIPDGTTAGRYHTKSESFLYIQLHNQALGNNSPAATNASKEWWEVVQKDGTRWRLGWTADAEQLAAMKGYPGAATGTWASLGYAGIATNVVASRWRADQVTDTYGNKMTFTYFEENRVVAGTSTNYNRANYMDTIAYTGHTSGTPAAGYLVVFVRENRAGEVPSSQNDWDNWDTYRLDRIEVKYGATVKRTYDLGYSVRSYSDDGKTWETTTLTSVAISGGGTTAPTTSFAYSDYDNRANCGTGCQEWAYPRLVSASNGWGGTTTYTYGNDGRPSTSWYNWRVEMVDIADGVNASPMKTTFAYNTPCYNDTTAGWCNAGSTGGLIGYNQTSATIRDFDGTTALAITVHKYHTDEQKAGREYETQNQNASGTVLAQANTTYTTLTSGLPTGGYFTFVSATETYLRAASLSLVSKTEYDYSGTTGNLMFVQEYDGNLALYRETNYEYVTNTSASVWILDTVSRKILKDGSGVTLSKMEYGYDSSLPGSGLPTVGKLTLSRVVDGTQTIDTTFVYDTYGNITETRLYKSYSTTGSQPAGTYISHVNAYDTTLKTYLVSSDLPLIPATTIAYADYGLGLPTTVTDANGNATITAYDGLGRVTSVKYPGFASPNIKYTYPTVPVSAPFSVKSEIWDQTASLYRSAWQVMDGLGRTIQSQSPYETAGYLVLTDTAYNAMGQVMYQGLPRTISGTGGGHFAVTWGSTPHLTNGYDALGRVASVYYADGNSNTFSYSGLRTTSIDRNSHKKVQENDAFGRLVKVEEYTGAGTYTLYASTTYEYDPRNLLKKVIDAAGNETTIGYNGFGRKTSMSDPDMGAWSYAYSVLGNLTSQTDARGCVITVTYDDLNRPLQKTYSGPGACATTPTVTYTYDSVTGGNEGYGRRTGMTDGSGSTTWFYNILGQVTSETHTVDGVNYAIGGTFDAFNRPLTSTLPTSEVLNYSYNAMGALSGLSGTNTYVSQIHYAASGQVTDQLLGNGLVRQSCYDANTLRLSGLQVYTGTLQACETSPSNPRLDLSYTYQANGNVSQSLDATRNETLTYSYDELDRLTSVSGPYTLDYEYNTVGNITSGGTTNIINAMAAGYRDTCALTTGGADLCWGNNASGQLGDGTYTARNTPGYVNGLTSGIAMTAVGNLHACALTTTGGVKCWGFNTQGQVGDGTTTERTTPVNVSGLTSGVTAITAGYYHTCALTTGGGVKCWGENASGQLGNGTYTNSSTPVNVSGLSSGVVAISAGGYHTCALLTGGAVKCWGDNGYGQLGDNSWTRRNTPVSVSGLSSGVLTISAGHWHTCASTSTGGVKCWGRNNNGQLGDGTTSTRITPVDVSGLTSGAVTVTAGGFHTCALTTTGGAKCWGFNTDGEVGDGTTTQRLTPVDVSGMTSGVASLDASYYHTCARTTTNSLRCWGKNDYKQLSDPAISFSSVPLTVGFPVDYTYGDPSHKHAVTGLSTGETYTYDANGNMTQRVEGGLTYIQTFNAENRLISVTVNSQTTQFIYDGDGNLVKKIKPDGSKTIYVGGVYEVDKTSGGATTRTVTYYPVAGAMRINSTVYYVLKDHLGSASVVTDSSGNIVGEQRYYPFGETRLTTGTIYTDRLFTGQQEMTGLGIYNYGARFYSPKLGRFLSADTIVPNPANPQDLNRFSYVRNNPLRYVDPTGHSCVETDVNGDLVHVNCDKPTTHISIKVDVPVSQQLQNTSCGEAVITMLQNYVSPPDAQVHEPDVITYAVSNGLFTPTQPPYTSPDAMTLLADHFSPTGWSSDQVSNQAEGLSLLQQQLQNGNPVAIDVFTQLNNPLSGQHFVVVTGVSGNPNFPSSITVTYNDPFEGVEATAPYNNLWSDWINNGDDNGAGNGWWLVFNQP